MPNRISYAQNGEDVRIWHAFGPRFSEGASSLSYVEVGANEPWLGSATGALYVLGWRGLLIEPDDELAASLRAFRPGDSIVEAAAAGKAQNLVFYRVPGTGLGTLDSAEAQRASERGFEVVQTTVQAKPLDDILDEWMAGRETQEIHALTIDVEGAEAQVLSGLTLAKHRPWVLCIEAVAPGTSMPTHARWDDQVLGSGYRAVAFDGVNRWYVALERADQLVDESAGAPSGTTIAEAIATPFHVLDIGEYGWRTAEIVRLRRNAEREQARAAWQKELATQERSSQVPVREYERQIEELRAEVISIKGSRAYRAAAPVAALGKKVLGRARAIPTPKFVSDRLIRERHLRHVSANMQHLTDSAYLGNPPEDVVTWASRCGLDESNPRPSLPPGLTFTPFTNRDAAVRWLHSFVWDSDAQLDSRMDNHNDEVGRARSALRTRIRLAETSTANDDPNQQYAGRVVFDARSLQTPAFGHRGIGRFAVAALQALRASVPDEHIDLIINEGLPDLPEETRGKCRLMTQVEDPQGICGLIQPSPMTHSPDPIAALLVAGVPSTAIVFDFIPLHYPTIYLRHVADRLEYASRLDALRLYSAFICISQTARGELMTTLGLDSDDPRVSSARVAWPDGTWTNGGSARRSPKAEAPIVLMTGDEPRKNTFGGLAGIAAATSEQLDRNVVVIGMAGQETRVHHWSIAAAMRPGEARTLGRVSDEELDELLTSAACVVVPSFDEGLSLPVIEAARVGTPIVASNIPSHRELIGSGSFLCDPGDPRSIARTIRKVAGKPNVAARQRRTLDKHPHESLTTAISDFVAELSDGDELAPTRSAARVHSGRLSIGVLTPWTPQPTGVADFSATVFSELAKRSDVTIYTTGDAKVEALPQRSIDEVFNNPRAVQERHDAIVSVVGNSHFHLPFVSALAEMDAIVVAHDTRMVEYYMALRGAGGVAQVMTTTTDMQLPRMLAPPLDEQIDDMRLLQNAAFWEIARRAERLILHSPSAAPRIEAETGVRPAVLPFANQRVPQTSSVTREDRQQARQRLGLDEFPANTIHLGSFGYLDTRTKLTDVVVEAAGWLTQWGHTVAIHLVGAASESEIEKVCRRAAEWGIHHLEVTGFQPESRFRDWLLAVDLGVQLRVSPLLGVSGPLSDLAAFGTPAVASQGLCLDVDTPAYIRPLADSVSPVTVAEAIEGALAKRLPDSEVEELRQDYLARKSPARYAELLLEIVEGSLR